VTSLSNEGITTLMRDGAGFAQPDAPTATTPRRVKPPGQRRQERMAQGFANIVAVLMRDPGFKNIRLADLEWLVLPAVLSGQWRLAHAKTGQAGAAGKDDPALAAAGQQSLMVPVAAALWASVSPQIDKRLSETADQPLMLRPNEWATGDIPWLIAVAGDRRVVPEFLKHLRATVFKGKPVKLRANGADGKVVMKTLRPSG
jgi:cytolysin-activating lysine-acyltransferase